MLTRTFLLTSLAVVAGFFCPMNHASSQQKYPARLTIINNTPSPLDLLYVDRDKNEQFIGKVPVKKPVLLPCPFNIVFVLRDPATKNEVKRVKVTLRDQKLVLGDNPKVAQPNNNGVPNVVGMFKVDADILLRKAGLNPVFRPGGTTNNHMELGNITAQSLQPNSQAQPGTQITLTYFRTGRPVPNPVKVPFVVAKSRWHAERRLLDWGLIPEGVEQGVANNPRDHFMVLPLFGANQNPDGNTQVQPGTTIRFKYLKTDASVGPYDASSPDRIPNIAVVANPDDSFDVAWMRRDEKTFISHFTGNRWAKASHLKVDNALSMLGGFTKDPDGNMYLATLRKEFAPKYRWDEGYAPNVAHVLKFAPGQREGQMLADLNQKQFTSRYPIINPILTGSAFHNTARLAYGNGALAFFFCHNVGAHNNVHETSNLIALDRNGGSLYSGGGAQHCMDLRLMFDGNNFVMAQVYDANGFKEAHIGLSKLKPAQGGAQWTNHTAIVRVPVGFVRLGGIVATPSGYQVVYTHGGGVLNSSNNLEWNGIRPDVAIKVVHVPKNFEEQGNQNYPIKILARPTVDRGVVVRPKVIDMKNGRSMVLWEQRLDLGHNSPDNTKLEATYALLMDANGNVTAGPTRLGTVPTQMSSDAFLLPRSGQAALVSGDAATNRLTLFTLDSQLNVRSYSLNLP